MSLKNVHPLYTNTIEDQVLMRDAYLGERVIKNKETTYLPATPGMAIDGMGIGERGRVAYDAYRSRAVFPDVVSDAVESLIGLLHQKPAAFDLPKAMEPLLDKATVNGEGLQALLRRINEQQLVPGRLGLLVDLPVSPDPANPMPFIAMYFAEAIRNWDDSSSAEGADRLSFVVLDETAQVRDPVSFAWKQQERYRVLQLDALDSKYKQSLFVGETFDPTLMQPAMIRGKTLEEIPFTFVNSKDTLPTPDNPPLLGLGRLALTIYRGEADYRQCLFMQGQDTLVVIGGVNSDDKDKRVGAGATIEIEQGGDAKYIGVSSSGLAELRQSLENDKRQAAVKSGQLVDAMSAQKESGEALKIRLAAQTASLRQIAMTGAAALERSLKHIALWMGLNADDVKVTPNLEFSDVALNSKELVELITAKTMGAPLAMETIHNVMRERGVTKLTFEEEMALIEDEKPLLPPAGTQEGGDPANGDPASKPNKGNE